MQTSSAGLDLIKKYEGCRLEAYKCAAGVPTIGYGHTFGVRMGNKITPAQAAVMLAQDVANVDRQMTTVVRVPLEQHQWDALASFVFNLGIHALSGSTLLKMVNQGKMAEAAQEFPKWTHGGGQVLPGLVARREAEKALFLSQSA